jgi:hypothetical protein
MIARAVNFLQVRYAWNVHGLCITCACPDSALFAAPANTLEALHV